jgi:Ser/Thr protein kinase RdoA (MazF antagonist)
MTKTAPDLARLTELFHTYSPESIVKAVRNTEAFANEVYDVTDAKDQRYFLKILKQQSSRAIATEAQMQQHLLQAGIKTPEYIEITPGSYVGEQNGTRCILSRYIPGASPKSVTPGLIESLGATLAKLHDALDGIIVSPNAMQWLNSARVAHDLSGYDGPVRKDLDTLFSASRPLFERRLPLAVIHGDLWMSNVFAKNDKITTVFDLETAEYTVRLIDLARTFTSMRFNSDYPAKTITDALTKGYNAAAKTPLSPAEQDSFDMAIGHVAAACATWHAVHGTRYRDPYIRFGKEALGLS